MHETVDAFRNHWLHMHAQAMDFAEALPEEHWQFSPHPRFASFAKQLRHVVCVRGVYRTGLVNSTVDWSSKHAHYQGALVRDELLDALVLSNHLIVKELDRIDAEPALARIHFMGNELSYAEFAHVMIHHEALHLGQWSMYAAFAGVETPVSWRLEWGL